VVEPSIGSKSLRGTGCALELACYPIEAKLQWRQC
jgi:hypothetical protein